MRYNIAWRATNALTLAGDLILRETTRSRVVCSTSILQRFGGDVSLGFQFNMHLSGAVHYTYIRKDSDTTDRSYYQNRVGVDRGLSVLRRECGNGAALPAALRCGCGLVTGWRVGGVSLLQRCGLRHLRCVASCNVPARQCVSLYRSVILSELASRRTSPGVLMCRHLLALWEKPSAQWLADSDVCVAPLIRLQ